LPWLLDEICGLIEVESGAPFLRFVKHMGVKIGGMRLLMDTRVEICGHTAYVAIHVGVLGYHSSSL